MEGWKERLVWTEGLEEWMRLQWNYSGKKTGKKWKKGEGNGRVG
jgi:hypothetical protein